MKARARARIEPLALIAAALAIAMAIYYVWLIRQQGNPPLPWVPALLLAGALLAAYGAVRELPYRHAALLAAAGALTTLGLLRFFPSGGRSSPPSPGPGLALARTSTAGAVMAASDSGRSAHCSE
jgi:peptidoglycan/LPS O-acetylase OafA/YrhL